MVERGSGFGNTVVPIYQLLCAEHHTRHFGSSKYVTPILKVLSLPYTLHLLSSGQLIESVQRPSQVGSMIKPIFTEGLRRGSEKLGRLPRVTQVVRGGACSRAHHTSALASHHPALLP